MTWKKVPGFGRYRVADSGEVRTAEGRELKPTTDRRGRKYVVVIGDDGERYNKAVAHLALLAFKGPPPPGRGRAVHKDDDFTNDSPKNLKWGTAAEQLRSIARHDAHATAQV